MFNFDKFIPDRRYTLGKTLGESRQQAHPFRETLINIAFAGLAAFTIVGSAACAFHLVFSH